MSKNVAIVATLLILGQAIVFFSSPVLTRLYSPDELGFFAIYLSVVYIMGSFAPMRFDKLVIVESLSEKKVQAFAASLLCSAFISVVAGVVLYFGDVYKLVFSQSGPLYSVGLIALSIFFYSAFQSVVNMQVSVGESKKAATSKLFQMATLTALQLCLFYMLSSSYSLVVAYLLSLIVSGALAFYRARSLFHKTGGLLPYFTSKIGKGLLGALSNTINVMSVQIIPILVTALFNPYLAGIYALAHRLTAAPMSILSQSIGQVFSPSLRDNLGVNPVKNYKTICYVILLNIFIFSGLFAFLLVIGESGFSFVFGREWQEAYEITLYLLVWMFSSSVVSPLSFIAIARGKEVQNLFFQIMFLICRVFALYIGWELDDIMLGFILLALFSSVVNFGYFYYLLSLTDLKILGPRAFWSKHVRH